MDQELILGTNILSKDSDNEDSLIGLPDPRFCNTMLAVMGVLYANGAADVFDRLREIDEQSREGGTGMGMSSTLDDLLSLKLDLASINHHASSDESVQLNPSLVGPEQ